MSSDSPSIRMPQPDRMMSLREGQIVQRDTLGFILDAVGRYGDQVRFHIMGQPVRLLNHPDDVQHVFLDNWRNYGRNTFQFQNFALVTGQGMLTTHGDYWQRRRRLAQPGFHQRHLAEMAEKMAGAVERLAERWSTLVATKSAVEVNVDPHMLRLALEIVGEALFSLNLQSEADQLSQEMLRMMETVVYRSQNLLAPPLWVPTRRNRLFRRSLADLDRRIYDLIAARKRSPGQHSDLLDMLVTTAFHEGEPMGDSEIRDEIITLIIAGYETVASGMGWIWELLAQRPALVNRLRAEIASVTHGRRVTMHMLNEMPLLNQVINESFRLYPPSWLITRRALADDEIAGSLVPAGELVIICPYAVHRHPDFWFEAERFDYERFSQPAAKARHNYAYIPFGGGPHLCIGRPFALLEAGLTLATLLPRFTLTSLSDRPTTMIPQVTLRPRDGLWMSLSRP